MKIMFVGLGLIGGSMAMALEGYPDLERYAVDGDEPTRLEALGRGVVRAAWPNADDAPIEDMDIIVICLHPEAAADFVRAQAGIAADEHDYAQSLLVCTIAPERDPDGCAWERFSDEGPVALLPLSARRCGLVLTVASAQADAALALRPTSAETLYLRGAIKLQLGQKQEADADLAAARKLDPKVEEQYASYGLLL